MIDKATRELEATRKAEDNKEEKEVCPLMQTPGKVFGAADATGVRSVQQVDACNTGIWCCSSQESEAMSPEWE